MISSRNDTKKTKYNFLTIKLCSTKSSVSYNSIMMEENYPGNECCTTVYAIPSLY